MLDINMEDVYNILENCKPYLIALGVALLLAVIVTIAVKKQEVAKRKLIRSQAWIAFMLVFVIAVNGICYGPLSTLISLTMGNGVIQDGTIAESEQACEEIADEGIVLLKNEDQVLPLAGTANLNVFGWASTNPCYGGSGSGAISVAYEKVSLLQGLQNAGFNLNTEITDFYTNYRAERPEMSPFLQDWTLPEPPAATYPAALMDNAKAFSDTALVVLSRTGSEAADLPTDLTHVEDIWGKDYKSRAAAFQDNTPEYQDFPAGTTVLELSQSEKDMIDLVCSNFDKVIVVYNGSNAFELGFVNEYEQIKGCVWAAGPGQNGFNSLGNVLNGTVNPSGKTTDTFVADLTATPYFNNIGSFTYDNMNEFPGNSRGDATLPSFVHYVEGIYVGYKFYETAAAEGLINYDESVVYPFGYGLSYTSFTQEMGSITEADGVISFDVTVTNTGDTAGKDVVEVYYNPPYTNGGIEKSAVNLVEFAKTGMLEPGASETVTISFLAEDMASFDADEAGAYVLESGDYVISINHDSHHVISSQVYHVDHTIVYDENNKRSTDETAAVTQLADSEGDVTYLSRADGFANYAEATKAPETYSLSEEYKAAFINNSNYYPEEHNNEADIMPVTGAKNGLELAALRGADYDDPRWEPLLDQLTVEEMHELIALGGYQLTELKSVGMVSTINCDGPASINNNFTGVGSLGFPSATMIANTWNKEMAFRFGEGIGKMADEMNVSGWYAPAMNTHRSAFGGRNFEYYSEDGLLSGKMAAEAIKGAAQHGVYSYIKHFALNEQELRRQSMICTWSDEQATREIYLKPFELAVKEGGATAVMSSYNYIGVTFAGAKSELLNNILRDEWGFQGFVLTDWFGNFGYMNADQIIRNGGASCLATYDTGSNYLKDTESATAVGAMRSAAKDIMYTVVNSRAFEVENIAAGRQTWQTLGIAIDVILLAGLIALETLAIRNYKRRGKEKQNA